MPHEQFVRLRDNIARDGVLTSTPLVHKNRILSGHHRIEAAVAAGITHADCIEILTELTDSQATAIQLSHNAIVGEDDETTLAKLYESLEYADKIYSGLTDVALVTSVDVELENLASVRPTYVLLQIAFLPTEKSALEDLMEEVQELNTVHMAHFDDFQRFFDAVVSTKRLENVKNSSVAIRRMADLAAERAAADVPEENQKQ